MNDSLNCPVCGREMVKTERKAITLFTTSIPASDLYHCEKGHERIAVVVSHAKYSSIFVYLGEGCYMVGLDNTSCENAIARMKREFYEESRSEHGIDMYTMFGRGSDGK